MKKAFIFLSSNRKELQELSCIQRMVSEKSSAALFGKLRVYYFIPDFPVTGAIAIPIHPDPQGNQRL